MPKVVSRDGKTQILDNTDTVIFQSGSVATITAPITAASTTIAAAAGYATKAQADAVALAVKKLVTIVKASGQAT